MKTLIDRIKERQNVWLEMLGVLITLKDGRTPLQKQVRKELGHVFPAADIFKTIITNNIKIEEAPANFQSIYAYDSGCLGACLYRDWIKKEFLKKHQKLEKLKVEKREAIEAGGCRRQGAGGGGVAPQPLTNGLRRSSPGPPSCRARGRAPTIVSSGSV